MKTTIQETNCGSETWICRWRFLGFPERVGVGGALACEQSLDEVFAGDVCVCLCGRCRVTTLVASRVESRVSLSVGESTAFSPAVNTWFSSWFVVFYHHVVDDALLMCVFFYGYFWVHLHGIGTCFDVVNVQPGCFLLCCLLERPSRRREHCGGQVLKLERRVLP